MFAGIKGEALKLAGITLHPRHRELLGRRAERGGAAGPRGWTALLTAVEDGDPVAVQRLIDLVTTRHTGFFRHPEHFELAAAHARHAVKERGVARLWSAGTATGEEAWSLAITMVEAFQRPDPPVEIVATDIHEAALAAAARAEYRDRALQALGGARRARFATEPAAEGRQGLVPALRRFVRFHPLNLAAAVWPVDGPFDVILCRNVLMYLEAGHRYAVLERLASLLAPDGLLFLDPAEHPGPAGHWFSPRAEGVYARRRGLPASRRESWPHPAH
ncbi:MAG: CheR family methyltransferase [Limisphaerales bacterium]